MEITRPTTHNKRFDEHGIGPWVYYDKYEKYLVRLNMKLRVVAEMSTEKIGGAHVVGIYGVDGYKEQHELKSDPDLALRWVDARILRNLDRIENTRSHGNHLHKIADKARNWDKSPTVSVAGNTAYPKDIEVKITPVKSVSRPHAGAKAMKYKTVTKHMHGPDKWAKAAKEDWKGLLTDEEAATLPDIKYRKGGQEFVAQYLNTMGDGYCVNTLQDTLRLCRLAQSRMMGVEPLGDLFLILARRFSSRMDAMVSIAKHVWLYGDRLRKPVGMEKWQPYQTMIDGNVRDN